jgi:hypothetical protein
MICKRCKCDNVESSIINQTISDSVITLHIKNVCGNCGKVVYTKMEYVIEREYEVNPPYLEIPQ